MSVEDIKNRIDEMREKEQKRQDIASRISSFRETASAQEQRIATAPAGPRNDTHGSGQTLMEKATSGILSDTEKRNNSMYQKRRYDYRDQVNPKKTVQNVPEKNTFAQWQDSSKKQEQIPKSTREYLGLSTTKGSSPQGAPSVRELLEQGRQERAEKTNRGNWNSGGGFGSGKDGNLPEKSYYEETGIQPQSAAGTVLDVIGRGAGYANSGVVSTADFLANLLPRVEGAIMGEDPEGTLTGMMLKPVTDATGMAKAWVQSTTRKIDEQVDSDTRDSKAARVAADLGSSTVAALPNTILAVLSGGASAASSIGTQASGMVNMAQSAVTKMVQNPMYWTSAAQTIGTSYDEAVSSGATEAEAVLAAVISTAFNSAVEVGGGVETLPSEIRNADLSTAQKALKWMKSALEEGGEEFVQGILERLTNKAVFDEEKPFFSTTDENAVFNPFVSAKEAGMGTAVGGILGGGQVLADTVMNRSAKWNADRLNAAFQEILDENNQKLNIDNTESQAYNGINENGGAFDGRNNQLDGASGEGVRTGRDGGRTDSAMAYGVSPDGRGNLSVPGIVLLSQEAQQTLTERGIVNVELHESSMDNAAFSAALDAARAADSKNGWAVTPKNANELTEAGTRTFMDRNGSTGFAIATDGDIEAVFANKAAGAPKGATKSTMPQAIANGGNKLDCYGFNLVGIYAKYGFVPVARVTFNPEYANPGWTADKGMPDIYFMMHNGDSADAVVQNMGKYKSWSKAELDALPLMEYDEAYQYRDSLMQGHENGHKNTGARQTTDTSTAPALTSENENVKAPADSNVAQTGQNVNGNQGQDGRPRGAAPTAWQAESQEQDVLERIATAPAGPRNDSVDGVLPETAVGAMKSDSQSFSYFQNQTDQFYPEGPNAARPVDMPKTGPTGRPVRRFANNAYGAQIMTDEIVIGLEQDFMAGKLEYDVVTDQAALERAQNTVAQDGYDRAFAQTVERLQSIKDMKNTSATAQVLINQAIQEGRQEDACVLLTLMGSTGTELGQGLQSYSMFRKLTPEGQLAGIQSVADRIDQQISEKNGVSSETKSQTLKAVNDVRETALRLLQNIRQAFGEGYQKNHGVPVEDWTTEIGNRLAKALEQRSGTRTPTTAQTIKNDLLRFAKGWVHQDQSTRTPRTSVDTLRDYFANRDAYNEAWNQARNVLSEKYKSNPQMLDSLDEFLTATIDYNGGTDSSVMLKAITEEAIAQELKDKNIQIRSFFGDHDAIENQISDALIRKTGAEGTDAGLIRAAVNRYITEQVNASETKTADVIDKDIRAMVGKIGEDISQIIRSSPGEKSEIASDIADLLTKQYGVSAENAASTASYIVQQFNEYVAEKSEAELRKRFGAKKKNLQKSFEQNFTELANMGAFTGSRYQSTVTEKLFGHAVTIDHGLIQEFLNASDQDARNEVMTKIYKDIAAQVPATFTDKWNAWRYLSMLGNPKTHVRNIFGNAMFAPVRGVKNQMGAVMEAVAEKAGWIDKSQRTKSVGFNWSQEDRARMAAAKADYANAEELILSGGKYNSATSTIEQNRRIFNNAVLETLRKGNSTALDVEDTWFSKPAYASSLAGYLKAQGFTAEDFTGSGMTDAQKDKARSYAIKEAQKATYRDVNAFSDMVSSIGFKNANSRWKKGVNTLIEGVMPFKRTPANILARGMEYSPAGLAKALTVDIVQVANGKLTAAEYMDHLASGLTGTGLFALGYLLSNMGLLTGGSPEDEDQADLEGRQPYALEIGGTSVTLDWLAPEALPVFMGVELSEAIQESAGKTVTMDSLKSFFNGLTGPVLEMSMMSSLQDALEATTYADNKIMSFLANAALGYVGQAFPTLFGQLERTVSGKIRETTFTQKTGFLDTDTQYALGNVANKIPFWDFSKVPYIDAWGRTQENGNMGARAFNNLLNPAYVSKINETPVDREIKRLEQATGANLTPSRADKKLTINNETILLTKDEYVTYATAKGQNDYTLRENLLNAEAYQGLDDDVKVKAMEYARSYADELARQEAGIQDVQTAWMQELAEADAETVTQALVAKAVESVLPTVSSGKYTSLADMVENNKIDDAMALSLCSESLQEAYYSGPSEAGITVQQWLDTYGYATSHAEQNDNDSKRAAAVEYANSLDISQEQRTALVNGMYSVMTDYIPKDVQPSNEFLLSQGQAGIATIEANMSESQKERYETYIKKTGVDMETYLYIWDFAQSAKNDKDKDGNVTKSAQEKVIDEIDKRGRTRAEKRNLFLSVYKSDLNLPYQWR